MAGESKSEPFGSFSLRLRPARVARNPRTGTPVSLPARYAPNFKPGKPLRERVNREDRGVADDTDGAGIIAITGGESVAMTRRLAVVSHVRMTRWAIETVAVDGDGPMVARLPDPAAVFDPRGERTERTRQWTRYRPGEQGRLALHGLAPLPVDIRLAALAGLDTVLAGDVLMLWTVSGTIPLWRASSRYAPAPTFAAMTWALRRSGHGRDSPP